MNNSEISAASLGAFVPAECLSRVRVFPEVDSTNTVLKQMAAEGAPAGTTVIADTQTAGRGRMDRRFVSPAGAGLYLSYLLRTDAAPEQLPELTAWVAVAAAEAVRETAGILPGIKWVNDLVVSGRKIAGILTERSGSGAIVIGVGINVSKSALPPDVAAMASSLEAVTGKQPSRAALAATLISRLDRLTADFPEHKAPYLAAYRESCITVGQEVSVVRGTETYHASAVAVTDDFSLLVRRKDGTEETVSSGEVSVRGLYGYV